MSRSLLILDRDGVINLDSDDYIKTLDEWIPIPSSIEAIARLSKAGWTVAVATNQSGIARGYYDLAVLEAMHARLRELVAEQGGEVGLIVYCPHGPDDGCDCRKPSRVCCGRSASTTGSICRVSGSSATASVTWRRRGPSIVSRYW